MNEQEEIDSLYSSNHNPIFKKYMSFLFPYDQEEYTNFGYWKGLNFPETIKNIGDRIASQRQLYELIHDSLNIHPNDRILEVGCGKGYGVKNLCERGFQCLGVDATIDQIKSCHSRHLKFKDRFIIGRAEALPFENASFDILYSVEAAQHFPHFEIFCREAARILKSKGQLSLTTFFLNNEDKRGAIEKIIPPTVEGTDNIISIDFALDCLQKADFSNLSVEKIGEYVFPQFARWQEIVIHELGYPKPPKEKTKWFRYYSMDDTDVPHPWMEAYQKGFLDYYVIRCCK